MEWASSVCGEEVLHVLPHASPMGGGSGLDVGLPEFPGFDSIGTEDVLVDLFEFIPLVVKPSWVEGVICSDVGFRVEEWVTVPSLSLSSSLPLNEGLCVGIGVGILQGPEIRGIGWSS